MKLNNDNLLNIYLEMIGQQINNIQYIYYTAKRGHRDFYKFNLIGFEPFIYKTFSIFASAENEDLYHVVHRLIERFGDKYTLNDVFIVVQRAIDKFLITKNKIKYNNEQSFLIISQSYPFQVVFQVSPNHLDFEDKEKLGQIYQQNYFGFIYTILDPKMDKNRKEDKPMLVFEEINVF